MAIDYMIKDIIITIQTVNNNRLNGVLVSRDVRFKTIIFSMLFFVIFFFFLGGGSFVVYACLYSYDKNWTSR